MRRYTQRRDARNGQRHTLAEDIRIRSRLDTYEKLREEVVLYAEARGTLHPRWVKCRRLERTETILWMLEDSDNGKDEPFPKERERNPTGTGKGKGTGKDGAKSSGRANTQKFKVSVGIAGKQVINRRTAGQGHSSRVKDSQLLLEREMMRKANQARVEERKENPEMLEHLCGIINRARLRARWHRLHHRRKQVQRLARLTRLSAQRWIFARLH